MKMHNDEQVISLFSEAFLKGEAEESDSGLLDAERRKPLTVGEVNRYVSELFAADPILHALRVQGEISGFKRHSSGHLYFSLKDENALVRCVMFRQNAMRLDFQPRDGMMVVLTGYASLYERDGAFQLYGLSLQKQGQGELYQRFMELKARLEEQGYFDPAHKREIPGLPQRVGLITSGTGAAVQDMLQIIDRRFPRMPIVIAPVKVQGEGAAEEIAGTIYEMNRKRAADVLLVGRGGGSMEDLWAFNEPVVARAIYESQIPIISAVGHETDFTIADFVADLRAPTPSAAAELAVPEWNGCVEAVLLAQARLKRALAGTVTQARSRIKLLSASRGFAAPERRIATERLRVDQAADMLHRTCDNYLERQKHRMESLTVRLRTLSPQMVLERGYAYVQSKDGATVAKAEQLQPADTIRVVMQDGSVSAIVEQIQIRQEG